MVSALKRLILVKYGSERYEFGCMIISMFLNHPHKDLWTVENVKNLAEIGSDAEAFITTQEQEKLRSLFKLKDTKLLF